jgi:ACS family pantothenate transporter-like MFS transporter
VLHWTLLDQGVIPAGQPFSLYLKAKSKLYSVTQINTLPTINTALSVVAALAAGLYADRTGRFWVPSVFASLGILVGCVLLAVWEIGETGRVAAFIITGTNGGMIASPSSKFETDIRFSLEPNDNVLGHDADVW